MQGHQLHPATPISDVVLPNRVKKRRGSYNCGRCGAPKKGHVCHFSDSSSAVPAAVVVNSPAPVDCSFSASPSPLAPAVNPPPRSRLPRALSFDDFDLGDFAGTEDDRDGATDFEFPDLGGSGKLPCACLWEVLRRLPPPALLSAAGVCKGWRDTARLLWRAAEELRLNVPAKAQVGHVRSLLQKCPELVTLSLKIESDVDATMLACIAFSCPKLESLEIFTSNTSVNSITGDELSHFLADIKCLANLKMEGCSNLGSLILCSSRLSTLWLLGLRCLSKMVFNCPSLREISLDFSRHENDNTDIATLVNGLGRSCPRLQNIHIASARLSHAVVLALAAANLRWLRMLSLVLGSEITDASVAAIASSYPRLELLDLSGSSISDCGIGMVCNVYPETLTKLLLALCPNITSSGIQFAAAQLPRLEIMDCGMTICDPNANSQTDEENGDPDFQKVLHLAYQKLIIKHNRLKKLSLWGCSGLDALYLNCPDLTDLNLNSCRNLQPERLLLQCPNLESVHASGCHGVLVEGIRTQVNSSDFAGVETQFPCKRLPDGSKRIQVLPNMFNPQPYDDQKKKRKLSRLSCSVLVNL